MKRKVTLYTRPRWSLLLLLLAAIAIVFISVCFLIQRTKNKNAYQEYVSMIPAAAEVDSMEFYIQNDGTLNFYAEGLYSFAVLSENSQVGSLQCFTVGGNTINAVFLPIEADTLKETILSALEQGIDIRNLYVPEDTDQGFLDAFMENTNHGKFIRCSGGEYQIFKDAAAYVLSGKESLSLTITHGDNTFLYSHDKKVGDLFDQKKATVSIMPYDVFLDSNLNTEYVFFPESEVDPETLQSRTDYYVADYKKARIYCLSTGNQVSFDIYLNATGRLKGE